MKSPVTIRLAVAADVGEIHAMLESLARVVGHPDSMIAREADLTRFGFGDAPAFEALIAQEGEAPIGMCLWFPIFSTWRGRPGVYVQDLFIDEAARGLGLGRKLLAAAAARGRLRGANHLRLAVDHANGDAKAAYRRIGLVHVEEDHIFQIDGMPFDTLADAVAEI